MKGHPEAVIDILPAFFIALWATMVDDTAGPNAWAMGRPACRLWSAAVDALAPRVPPALAEFLQALATCQALVLRAAPLASLYDQLRTQFWPRWKELFGAYVEERTKEKRKEKRRRRREEEEKEGGMGGGGGGEGEEKEEKEMSTKKGGDYEREEQEAFKAGKKRKEKEKKKC